ncbi:DUF4214 domain-containing protein [Duganella sp. LX20W]|uniref:DUF4214 domain-containing protein n=2 Tax=Rugamonas brunnea TaxID=2758569 RepID=A0A7W2EWP5_9BURK|nr:DUF4214 domain-containing protein [Rugamonas brunnea]MBA5640023.1 DUF4214 domain-containing protein [Rugamonas brunnea]
MATNTELVQQLYVAYYNRPADVDGLAFYVKALDSGATVAEIAKNFATGPEYVATFAGMQADEIIDTIYVNLFGRHADKTGLNFWGNELTSGISPLDVIVRNIAAGALNADGTLNADGKVYANKVAAAVAFTKEIDTVGNEQERVAYASGHVNGLAKTFLAGVTDDASLVAATNAIHTTGVALVDAYTPVTTTALTTGVDLLTGTSGNDVFNGVIGTGDTLNALDSIDGGAGADTLNVLDVVGGTAIPTSAVIKNVETIAIRSAGATTFDATADANITGLTKIAVTQAAAATITAGSTTAIAISGATGAIEGHGGSTQTVSTSTGNAITLDGAAGAISVTDTKQGAAVVGIDGGTNVAVTASGVSTGTVTIGHTTHATGDVIVSSTGAAFASAGVTLGAIGVEGGATVSVTQAATSDASAAAKDTGATGHAIVESAVTIAGTKTTSVTVQQTATAAGKDAVAAAAGASTVDVVTFAAMAKGDTITVGGLTFTAAKALTAAEAAAAFADLSAGTHQGNAAASNGTYSGSFSTKFNSGDIVVSGTNQTVTFTSAAKDGSATIVTAGSAAAPAVSETTAGSAANDATTGVLAVTAGQVLITSTDNKITTVTLDGYGASSSVSSEALSTLSLAHSDASLAIVNGTATTLGLTLDGVGVAAHAALDLGTTYTTLNITTANANSAVDLSNDGNVAALNVAGTNVVNLLGSAALSGLKTVTVTGSAGVKVDASGANVTAVDTSGTTGNSSVTVNGQKATFTGGAGVDTVTLSTTAPAKAIALGAGDDVLKLAAGTTSIASTGSLAGGDGTDTIVFADAADANVAAGATLDGAFASKISGFEVLGLTTFGADNTVNLHNLDDINSIVIGGSTAGTLTLDKLLANSTVEFDGASAGTVVAKLADTSGTADVLNVVTKVADVATGFNKLVADGVETFNLTATDTNDDADATTVAQHTIDLQGDSVKSIVVSGNADVVLTGHLVADAINVKLALVDATAMTGALTATTNGTLAETIKGGAGADTLTAIGNGDTLNGGAGNDKLVAQGDLDILTGGAGNDKFDVSHATTNVNSYATITDLTAGDSIVFSAAATFAASKVVLGDTAVFQDYANAAIKATANGDLSWFQIGGNTYIVEHDSGASTSFVNGQDMIVKITGTVDLSHASLNTTDHILLVH